MLSRLGNSYANVTATLALVVALGGTSYAAIVLPKNSVGPKQIKPGAVKTAELGRSAVISQKVKDRSLLAKDFKAGQLPAGAKGDTGATGPQGNTGAAGLDGDDGTAVAYAHVNAAGGVAEARSKNLADANVTKGGTGTYCFRGLGFTPKNAVATADLNTFNEGESDRFVTVNITGPGTNHGSCGVGITAARVYDVSDGVLRDGPFWIWFED